MDELKYYNTREEYEEELNTLHLSDPTVAYIKEEDEVVYVPHSPINDYFTTVALEDDTVFYCSLSWLTTDQGSPFSQLSYSLDGGETWTTTSLGNGIQITTPVVNTGDEILWKGIGKVINGTYYPKANNSSSRDSSFFAKSASSNSFTYKSYSIKGNAMSLLYGDDFSDKFSLPDTISGTTYPRYEGSSCFEFKGNLISAKDLVLPATTLKEKCYKDMFYGCSSLVEAPKLPATTLAERCYDNMFYGCTSLTNAPDLPAPTLADSCYYCMFKGCTSLTEAPELPATTLVSGCYNCMFQNCTSLTMAPELPATTLATGCYDGMFNECSSLNYIKAMFTTSPGTTYTNNWVLGVAATGTFVKNSAATWTTTGTSSVPSGWTVETYTP